MRRLARLLALTLCATATTAARAQTLDWSPLPDRACYPTASSSAAFAFDSRRERTVALFGNRYGSGMRTWIRNQGAWTVRPTPSLMAPRHGHAIAYDPVRDRVVLFGGSNALVPTNLLSDTWEFDGAEWRQITVTVGPSARTKHGMAFDPVNQQVVLIGGTGRRSALLSDMWSFDGTSWNLVMTYGHPGPGAAATDQLRGVVVWCPRFGFNAYAAEWDGTSWSVPASQGPTRTYSFSLCELPGQPRVRAHSAGELWDWDGVQWTSVSKGLPTDVDSMLHDPATGATMLFGGSDRNDLHPCVTAYVGGSVLRGEWTTPYAVYAAAQDTARNRTIVVSAMQPMMEWDGRDWHELPPPPAAGVFPLVYDPLRSVTVLAAPQPAEWNGIAWTSATSVRQPNVVAATFHDVRGTVVGVANASGTSPYELFEWRAAQWQSIGTAPSIPPHIAYDPVRDRLVDVGPNYSTMETWEWDGTNWTLTAGTLPPLTAFALAWDPSLQRIVAHGGVSLAAPPNNVESFATYLWDGSTWTLLNSTHNPSAMYGGGMVFDPRGQRLLRLGGLRYEPLNGGTYGVSGMWELSTGPAAATANLGSACGIAPPRLVASLASLANPTFGLDLDRATPGIPAVFALGALDVATAVGPCFVRPSLDLLTVAVTDVVGIAAIQGPVPNTPSLRGLSAFAQAFVLDGTGPALGLSLSNALRIDVGP